MFEAWRQYRRNIQRIQAMSISRSFLQRKQREVRKVERMGKEAAEQAKASTNEATQGFSRSVNGQFGKKVIEVLDIQNKTIDNLHAKTDE